MSEAFLTRRGGTSAKSLENAVVTLGLSLVYTGSELIQTVASVVLKGNALTPNTDYVVINNAATNAGSYSLAVVGIGKYSGMVQMPWTIAKATIAEVPSQSGALVYNGGSLTPTWLHYDTNTLNVSGDTSAINAGTYNVAFTPKANYQWADGTTAGKIVPWTIQKRSFAKPTVSGTKTYNGSAQEVTLNGYDSAHMSMSGDYSATNAGTYAFNVALRDTANTQWADQTTQSLSLSWTIDRAKGSISASPASLSISGAAGKTATSTITKTGDGAISIRSSATGKATASLSGLTVTVRSVDTGSASITITMAQGVNYTGASCTISVTVQIINVFGVMWNYANSSPELTRLTPSSDPNGFVTASPSSEPTAAVGTSGGSSPFDAFSPWKDMVKYNADASGNVSAWTSNANDTVVRIPAFYAKIVDDTANSKLYIYISNAAVTGLTKHPGSDRYVGRYATGNSNGYVSKTGLSPAVSMTRATARTNSANKGSKWWQYDYAALNAIWLLYLVEWASWDSQKKIGQGVVSSSSALSSGGTDSMTHHTGRAAGTDGQTAVQYRWIENLWGNVFQFVDGINISDRKIYVCTDPTKWADDTANNYTATGVTIPGDGWITGMSPGSTGWSLAPDNASGGSSSTYVTDYCYYNTGWRVLFVGGDWNDGACAGLFFFCGGYSSTYANTLVGARLQIIP